MAVHHPAAIAPLVLAMPGLFKLILEIAQGVSFFVKQLGVIGPRVVLRRRLILMVVLTETCVIIAFFMFDLCTIFFYYLRIISHPIVGGSKYTVFQKSDKEQKMITEDVATNIPDL